MAAWFASATAPRFTTRQTGRENVMHGDYRVVDADGHVIEPADLWEKYIDPEFRDQAPRCFGAMSVDVLGHRMPDVPAGRRPARASPPGARRIRASPSRPEARLRRAARSEAMDVEGIDMAVLYPSRGCSPPRPTASARLAGAICRAYNRWLAEFCSFAPGGCSARRWSRCTTARSRRARPPTPSRSSA
jgi:hypothetical protein